MAIAVSSFFADRGMKEKNLSVGDAGRFRVPMPDNRKGHHRWRPVCPIRFKEDAAAGKPPKPSSGVEIAKLGAIAQFDLAGAGEAENALALQL